MELTRRDIRAMILYDFKAGLSARESYDRLTKAFDSTSPCYATVKNWFAEFRRGRMSLDDELREGRPSGVVTPATVEAVREMISEEPRSTYAMIEHAFELSPPQVSRILHENLAVKKRCARWVPRMLTEAQRQARVEWCHDMIQRFHDGNSRSLDLLATGDETWIYVFEPETKQQSAVWLFPGDEVPLKSRKRRSANKKMVCTFFGKKGHFSTSVLEDRRTVNADWYTNVALSLLISTIQQRHPRGGLRNLLVHHDNATAHTAMQTREFLAQRNIQLVGHPPYSPDLAPCDFFLFPTVKSQLRGRQFNTAEEAVNAYQEAVQDLTEDDFHNCFLSWFARMRKCIDCDGGWFEKL